MPSLDLLLAITIPALAGVVWLLRLEGRVNGHQVLFGEREKLADAKHEALVVRLERIEGKLDRLCNGR